MSASMSGTEKLPDQFRQRPAVGILRTQRRHWALMRSRLNLSTVILHR